MATVLVVCTGNVCRSPMAEGLVRRALTRRLGSDAPSVSSAGTAGWEGSGATPEAVEAAAERGVDVSGHHARKLTTDLLAEADLVLAMAGEHREAASLLFPEAKDRTFTLKELVRLLEELPEPDEPSGGAGETLAGRVAAAAEIRRGGHAPNPWDEDIVDPLGMPLESYRAIAWELDGWIDRLVRAIYGAPGEVREAG